MTDWQNEPPPPRRRWTLSGEAFDRLLEAFDSDREAASHQYEELRRKLIDLFSWERSEAAEDSADEVLNRIARRVMEGAQVSNLTRYAFGIARLVLQEEARSRRARAEAAYELRLATRNEPDSAMLELLRQCLDALPKKSRQLLERYYSEDRSRLAAAEGITVNALRNRVMRLRQQLYDCVAHKRDIS